MTKNFGSPSELLVYSTMVLSREREHSRHTRHFTLMTSLLGFAADFTTFHMRFKDNNQIVDWDSSWTKPVGTGRITSPTNA